MPRSNIANQFFVLPFIISLLANISGYSQQGTVFGLTASLNSYSKDHLQEKIFIHTDKSFYLTGEIIWFKVYVTDSYLNKPLDLSKVAYIEIYTRDKKPVLQAKIELNNAKGNGSFLLPYSLASGTYILRAYTNWMKNFSPDYFFETPITIINPLKKLSPPNNDTTNYEIQFFPEGGNLVTGLQSKVAFHAVDQNGKGINCKGIIVNQNNDSITSFTTLKFGMGHFEFTPLKENIYKAIVQAETGHSIIRNLPTPYEKGYSMRLTAPRKDKINVTVNIHEVYDENLFLLVHTRQIVKIAQTKLIKNGTAEFEINKQDLGEGISHFTIFNERRQPVCERLFFIKPEKQLELTASTDRSVYSLRQKTDMKISISNNDQDAAKASLSLSVFKIDSLQDIPENDIQNYLWLKSDLKGTVESPSYYFTLSDADLDEATDNLMLTHGWSRFKWEDVLSNKKTAFEFLPEYEGLLIRGKLTEKSTGLPAKNVPAYLSVTGERFVFKSSSSDQNGNIFFGLNKFYGTNEIIIQPHDKTNGSYIVNIPPPFANNFSSAKIPALRRLENLKEDLTSHSVASQVENTFVQENKQQFFLPALPDTTVFFGSSSKSYLLDDYTRFITMEEVLREYVAEIRVRKQQDKFIYKVRNQAYQDFFDDDPLILLDGVLVFDVNKLMAYDPLKIKKLDIVTQRYFSGTEAFDGIVSYDTYKGDLDGYELDPNALILEYPGLQLHREFYSPVYDTREKLESRLPDFRNLLYWSPDIKSDENGQAQISFYTSDKTGKYAVVIQGINSNGLAGSKTVFFNVTKQ